MNNLFIKYADDIIEYNKIHMLTGFNTKEEIELELFKNSINSFEGIDLENKSVLDIGTGCGIPGVPIKLQNPSIKLTLLETLTKRINFLKQINSYIDFDLLHGRAEELALDYKEQFDIVTMRAFAHTSVCLEIGSQFCKVNGLIVLIKGPKVIEEIKESKVAMHKLGFDLVKKEKMNDNKNTVVVTFIKTKKTNEKYPRSFQQIKKERL